MQKYDEEKLYAVKAWGESVPEMTGKLIPDEKEEAFGIPGYFFHPSEDSVYFGRTIFLSSEELEKHPPREIG